MASSANIDNNNDKARAETLLLDAIRSHDIHVQPEQIQQILQGQQGETLIQWAIDHLNSDNLLTQEELDLYKELDTSGQVDRLADAHDLSDVQALHHQDIRAAIDELNRSTATISKQTETLRHQHDALSRLTTRAADSQVRRQELESTGAKRAASQRLRAANEVAELSRRVKFHISELSRNNAHATTSQDQSQALRQSLADVFASDDKLLSSLQKLGWELDQPDPDADQPIDKLRETCLRLIKVTVETIRTRLDTTYLDALMDAQHLRPAHVDDHDIEALQDEVESLYAEILPVAQMSVEQQHQEPALVSVSSQSGRSLVKTATALTYMNECLDYLLDRVNCLQSRISAHHSHQAALKTVISTAESELAKDPNSQNTPDVEPRKTSHQDKSRRRSSGFHEVPPLQALMQSLSLPMEAFDETNPAAKTAILQQSLKTQFHKNRELSQSAQQNLESVAASQLHDARQAIQRLRDSLVAESSFGAVTLVDPEIQESIQVLGQEVDKAKQRLGKMDLRVQARHSEAKEDLIDRWTR